MKKSLLLLACGAIAFMGMADDAVVAPSVIEGIGISKVSPNGKWIVSSDPYYTNTITIVNTETGDSYTLEGGWDDTYDAGMGNCVSNDGIVLFSTDYAGTAKYWFDGEVFELPIKENDLSAFSNGITPDGKRVVGTVGIPMTDEEVTMQRPAVWTRNDDGSFGEYVLLPSPELDFCGRVPQYINANYISDDGKVISAIMTDGPGFLLWPIVYKEVDGEWTMEYLHKELFNPEGIEIPEFPGEFSMPEPEDFMSPEQRAAYTEACDNWDWSSGEDYPEAQDYMTEEEYAAYMAACEAAEAGYEEWGEKYQAWYDAYNEICEASPAFSQNSDLLSANGLYYGITFQRGNAWFGEEVLSYPYIFNLEDGTYKTYQTEGRTSIATWIGNDKTMLTAAPASEYVRSLYIIPANADAEVSFYDWCEEKYPEIHKFLDENCRHTMVTEDYVYNPETDDYDIEIVEEDAFFTGQAVATADMETIYSLVPNYWDFDSEDLYYTYVLPLGKEHDGVNTIAAGKKLNFKVMRGGIISINGDAASVAVYDAQGRQVYRNDAPAAVISTGLNNGIFAVCVTDNNGKTTTQKVAF